MPSVAATSSKRLFSQIYQLTSLRISRLAFLILNLYWRGVRFLELSLHQLPPSSCCCLPFRRTYLSPHRVVHSGLSFCRLRDQPLHPYCWTTRTIILMLVLIFVFVKTSIKREAKDNEMNECRYSANLICSQFTFWMGFWIGRVVLK